VSFAKISTLASFLSQIQNDTTLHTSYLNDALEELNRIPFHVEISKVAVVQGTALYTAPAAAITLLGGVYDDRWLDLLREEEAQGINPLWRSEIGAPEAIVYSIESARSFRLYPAPDIGSSAGSFEPDSDYDPLALYLFHTEAPADVLDYLDVPLTLSVLSREFAREAWHQDLAFAEFLKSLAARTMQMIL
jgi:hypothetical protein